MVLFSSAFIALIFSNVISFSSMATLTLNFLSASIVALVLVGL